MAGVTNYVDSEGRMAAEIRLELTCDDCDEPFATATITAEQGGFDEPTQGMTRQQVSGMYCRGCLDNMDAAQSE